ncbi:tannase and feruloyl esterase [Atractiella rhizophila]|nr:tannase and feruloyl esterase [Atractiella rhizophila]
MKLLNSSHSCSSLFQLAPLLLPNLTSHVAQDYPAGTTFTDPTNIPGYNTPVPNLSAFCRYGGEIKTSNSSKTRFEIWLPTAEEWNGRFAFVGNGGDAGGINYPDMGIPLSKYHFAVASTDAGHNGTGSDGSFALLGDQVQIDFGWRAVHLSTVYAKAIAKAYYGSKPKYAYWLGCSSGGKQGLKEAQMFPDDYDGILAGAAAQWWPHLNGWTYRVNAITNPVNSAGHLTTEDYATIGALVLQQCDGLDGVEDGIIVNPRKCHPDLSPLEGQLSAAKLETMKNVWANWTAQDNGELMFFGFEPGSEGYSDAFSVTGVPFGPAPDYFRYQVLNETTVGNFSANDTELLRLTRIADVTDPGQTNAIDPNIKDFLKRGKLMTFVGLSDTLIPSGSSLWYYERVRTALKGFDISKSYRLFAGMPHCRSGNGAYNFGGPGQSDLSINGSLQSSVFDAQHDAILALMQWTEKGVAPNEIIGSKYINDNKNEGVKFERKLCPYPQDGVYIGGDSNKAESFTCKFVG